MDLPRRLAVRPGSKIDLADHDPADTLGLGTEARADKLHAANVARLAPLVQALWADNRYALLVVLQGMDTSGKDGAIRHVFSGVNPQACRVKSFKKPTEDELEHDFLWRVHAACPRRGEIGIFNRSHYEDVLVVRVHGLVPKPVWRARYGQINRFERHLHDTGTRIVKCFLHISKEEQKQRLEERIKDPLKGWKMEPGDLAERALWDDYGRAYEAALERCSTDDAPWHIIPADRKWVRDAAISSLLVRTLDSLKLRPRPARADIASLIVPD